ncbi:hypothetical protein [Paenibacillus arenosi]|uniref:Uncharacterized protein n=1 Tax=Paenibacillus arenosi TaxID=2774142 RepID=A0ABR9AXK4_9BACL|nr:hypothetical protein [Paenibacillus arenosi]MBD8498868.1 hypothetical protein [Paenibacillus arenosi]
MLSRYIVGGRLDPPYYPTKTMPLFKGRFIGIPNTATVKRVIKDIFYLSHDVEFYAISIHSTVATPEDYWTLSVDGNLIAKNVYCKQYSEGLYFQVAHAVERGKEFIFEYHTSLGDGKSVEVMYHFLTDPNINLELEGGVDVGKYPDPPPIPPEGKEPPQPPAGGGITLPVTWSPFLSVTEANKWTKDLGVSADYANNLDAANYITEALAHLLNNCPGFADMIQKRKLNIRLERMRGANGSFDPVSGTVAMNKNYDFKRADQIARAEYDSGQKSSPDKLRTIIHEIGHWLHYHNVGEQTFAHYSNLDPDAYGPRTILPRADENYISTHLCHYATKFFPIELTPEVFTAKITGVPVDTKIWEWYEQYGGYKCSGW